MQLFRTQITHRRHFRKLAAVAPRLPIPAALAPPTRAGQGQIVLEIQTHAELEFPHLRQAGQCENLACRRRIHCGVRLAQVHVIEEIEDLRPELPIDSLANLEAFAGGSVRVEEVRTEEGVARDVAESSGGRAAPRTTRTAVGVQFGDGNGGREAIRSAGPGRCRCKPARRTRVGNACRTRQIRAARPGVGILAAIEITGRERNARFPCTERGDLPSACDGANKLIRIAQERLAFPERQFVDPVEVKDEAPHAVSRP